MLECFKKLNSLENFCADVYIGGPGRKFVIKQPKNKKMKQHQQEVYVKEDPLHKIKKEGIRDNSPKISH